MGARQAVVGHAPWRMVAAGGICGARLFSFPPRAVGMMVA